MFIAKVRQRRAVEFIALAALAVAIFVREFLVVTGTGREEECDELDLNATPSLRLV